MYRKGFDYDYPEDEKDQNETNLEPVIIYEY